MSLCKQTEKGRTVASGRECLLEILRDEGVTHIFGNPGTTELPLIDALAGTDDFEFVLGLQEATVVGMADGYAQATGRPAFVNLHTTAGLGNGLGNLTNAFATNVPMVVTAGQQDSRHLIYDPLLSGDLVGLARSTVKWAHEVRSLEELPIILRRAFRDANTEPKGPVFLSLPMNIVDEIGEVAIPPKSRIIDGGPGYISELTKLLTVSRRGKVCLVLGDEVGRYSATDVAVRVAELLGADVFGSPFHSNVPFPTHHPLWRFNLPLNCAQMRESLEEYDCILLIGDRAFMSYTYAEELPYAPGTTLIQIAVDKHSLGRSHAVDLGLCGNPALLLEALERELSAKGLPDAQGVSHLAAANARRQEWIRNLEMELSFLGSERPLHPLVAANAVLRGVPPEMVIVDECLATNDYVRQLFPASRPNQYFHVRGAGLGWGMPAACGVSLGLNRQPVLCLVGDGAAMYSPQALWTAAHENLPVTFVVFNNSEYNILKNFMRNRPGYNGQREQFVGMDLTKPAIDYCSLAAAHGVEAIKLTEPAEISSHIASAIRKKGPSLIEVSITATK